MLLYCNTLKGSQRMGRRGIFKNLCTCLFNDDLSEEPNFGHNPSIPLIYFLLECIL
jgi:hypothetical protein